MKDRTDIMIILGNMPEEAFDYLVLATAAHAMTHGARTQIWPDGIGGFTGASRAAIAAVRKAAEIYLDAATKG